MSEAYELSIDFCFIWVLASRVEPRRQWSVNPIAPPPVFSEGKAPPKSIRKLNLVCSSTTSAAKSSVHEKSDDEVVELCGLVDRWTSMFYTFYQTDSLSSVLGKGGVCSQRSWSDFALFQRSWIDMHYTQCSIERIDSQLYDGVCWQYSKEEWWKGIFPSAELTVSWVEPTSTPYILWIGRTQLNLDTDDRNGISIICQVFLLCPSVSHKRHNLI